jgi:hypothetical protein
VSSSLRELCSAATALWIDELDPLVQVRVATWSLLWSASPDHFARQECVSDRDFLTVGLEAALATAASSGDVDLEISAFADVVKMARLPDALATRLVDALLVRLDDDDDRGAHVAITGVNEALRTLLAQPAASRTRFLDLLERHPHLSVSETRAAVRATARADQAHALAGVDVWSLSPSADLELGADFELSVLVRAASELTPEQLARLEDSWSTSNPLTRDAQDLLDAAAVS